MMRFHHFHPVCPERMKKVTLVGNLILLSLLVACGGPEPTPQVLVVTATFTSQPEEVVETATSTPLPEVSSSEAVPSPSPTDTPALDAPAPPTATTQAEPTVTLRPTHTASPISLLPTETPVPETPTAAPTLAPSATSKPRTSLASYRVIYSHFDGGDQTDENKYSVWVMRGDGKQAAEILRPAIEPAYSPDGKKIAYYRPFTGIWVYDLNKKSATHVVVSDYAEFASFSPDGEKLVFHEWIGNWWSAQVNLFVVNVDGGGRSQLLPGIRPCWSPNGNLLAFDSCRGTDCGIFVVQPNGQGLRQVTSDGGGKVSWSPDGKTLAYSTEVDGDPEIWVVNADGSGRKQLTRNTGNDTLPVYSPDGQYIYFLSDQDGTAWAIRVMNADGSNVRTTRRVGVPPRWQFSRLWVGWW
jgi:TolB protein